MEFRIEVKIELITYRMNVRMTVDAIHEYYVVSANNKSVTIRNNIPFITARPALKKWKPTWKLTDGHMHPGNLQLVIKALEEYFNPPPKIKPVYSKPYVRYKRNNQEN